MKNTANGSAKRNHRITAHLRRIQDQVAAIERSLSADSDSSMLLQRIAATRAAISGLMVYLMEDRLRTFQIDPNSEDANEAIEEMIDVVHCCLK